MTHTDHSSKELAALLHCSPAAIPKPLVHPAEKMRDHYIRIFSMGGMFALSPSIVYNRICYHVSSKLKHDVPLTVSNFDEVIRFRELFFSFPDLVALIRAFKPIRTVPSRMCWRSLPQSCTSANAATGPTSGMWTWRMLTACW